jgi:hypothetical protein
MALDPCAAARIDERAEEQGGAESDEGKGPDARKAARPFCSPAHKERIKECVPLPLRAISYGTRSCSPLSPRRGRAIAFEETQRVPPPPAWGRIEVGEASEDCLTPKRGFPLPNLPQMGEEIFGARTSYAIALRGGGSGKERRALSFGNWGHPRALRISPCPSAPRVSAVTPSQRSFRCIADGVTYT